MSGRHRRDRASDPAQDQLDAAVHEVHQVMERTAAHIGRPLVIAQNDDPSDPTLAAWVARLREGFEGRDVPHCLHVLGTWQPMFINAWDRPLEIRCLPCNSARPPLVGDDDVRCDTCGKVDPTGLWPLQLALGPIVIAMARCDDCAPAHRRGG